MLESPCEPPGRVPSVREGVIAPTDTNPDGTLDVRRAPELAIHRCNE